MRIAGTDPPHDTTMRAASTTATRLIPRHASYRFGELRRGTATRAGPTADASRERVHRRVAGADPSGRIAGRQHQAGEDGRPPPDPQTGAVQLECGGHREAHRVEQRIAATDDEADEDRPG